MAHAPIQFLRELIQLSSDMSSPYQSISSPSVKPLQPKLDINVGPRSHFFQPPSSPSTSSVFMSPASPQKRSSGSYVLSRKRSRHGDSVTISGQSSSVHLDGRSTAPQKLAASTAGSPAPSPAPFVNTKYRLAGGLDTPTAAADSFYDRIDRNGSDARSHRRNWGTGTKRAARDDDYDDYGYPSTPAALGRERNGQARGPQIYRSGDHSQCWRKAVINAVGTVAGTLWQFCWTRAFRGFSAGGGRSYMMEPVNDANRESREQENHDAAQGVLKIRPTTPPSTRPSDERFTDDIRTSKSTPPRPAKRIQREKGGGEWVMVKSKAPQKPSMSPMYIAGSGSPRKRVVHSAASRPGRPAASASVPASFASPRTACPSTKDRSPATAEAQRLVAKRARQERQVDASIQKFNEQLKAMIREGKEALGTRFEVDDEIGGMGLGETEDEYVVEDEMTASYAI